MKILHITVKNKIATYAKRDGDIVCGNGDYQVKFTFDEEWDASSEKTARFIWNGKYYDVKFTGDTCDVPVITNADSVQVGVYTEDDALQTTTSAVIGCKRSVRCGGGTEHPESSIITYGEVLQTANEAKTTAEEAKTTAEEAKAASQIETDPANVRNEGKYTAKVVFATESSENYFDVYALDADGNPIRPPLLYRGSGNNEMLPIKNEFEFVLPMECNGLHIETNATSYKMFAPLNVALTDYVKATDLEAAIGDVGTALDELHSYAQALVNGGDL